MGSSSSQFQRPPVPPSPQQMGHSFGPETMGVLNSINSYTPPKQAFLLWMILHQGIWRSSERGAKEVLRLTLEMAYAGDA